MHQPIIGGDYGGPSHHGRDEDRDPREPPLWVVIVSLGIAAAAVIVVAVSLFFLASKGLAEMDKF